jgi:hypothetical protein
LPPGTKHTYNELAKKQEKIGKLQALASGIIYPSQAGV